MRFICLLAACSAAFAQKPADPDPKPDPKKLDPVPGNFRAYIVQDFRSPVPVVKEDPADPDPKPPPLGPTAGKRNATGFQHDLIADNELNPTVVVFARKLPEAGDGLDKLADKLMDLSAAYGPDGFGGYLFFPTLEKGFADPSAIKAEKKDGKIVYPIKPVGPPPQVVEALTAWAKPLDAEWAKRQPKKLPNDPPPFSRLVVGLTDKDGTVAQLKDKKVEQVKQAEAWNLPKEGTTIIFYHRLKVVKRWELPADPVTAETLDAVAKAVADEMKK